MLVLFIILGNSFPILSKDKTDDRWEMYLGFIYFCPPQAENFLKWSKNFEITVYLNELGSCLYA